MNSPKRVDLAGFLHGHPGTDEAGDQTAGQRGERKKGKLEMKGWETQRDRGRTDKGRKRRESVKIKTETTGRSAKVHFLFNLSFIHYNLKINLS